MSRKISDEQLDRIAAKLVRDFTPDAETLDQIADSPKLWWNVRRTIEAEKSRRAQSRFFALRRQFALAGGLAILFSVGVGILFLNSKTNPPLAEVKENQPPKFVSESVAPPASETPAAAVNRETPEKFAPRIAKVFPKKASPINPSSLKPARSVKNAPQPKAKVFDETAATETKTDFIALSYSTATDSGQIVRVKVPSSMMISLGVTNEVKEKTALVNAEVVIGDDGMARAIRFIR